MSIAAISSAFVSYVGRRADAAVTGAAAVPAVDAATPQRQGRRHELVDAMAQAMGVESPDRKTQQSLFRFAHALMHDLRAVSSPEDAVPGGGRAWGRQSWSDLGARIDALATAVSAGTGTPAAQEGDEVPTASDTAAAQAPAAAATAAGGTATTASEASAAPAAELAPPQPLTRTTAALWLSQVPSSRLLEAFATLSQALPAAGEATGDSRTALAAFLQKLSAAVTPTAVPEPTAGSLFHATA